MALEGSLKTRVLRLERLELQAEVRVRPPDVPSQEQGAALQTESSYPDVDCRLRLEIMGERLKQMKIEEYLIKHATKKAASDFAPRSDVRRSNFEGLFSVVPTTNIKVVYSSMYNSTSFVCSRITTFEICSLFATNNPRKSLFIRAQPSYFKQSEFQTEYVMFSSLKFMKMLNTLSFREKIAFIFVLTKL